MTVQPSLDQLEPDPSGFEAGGLASQFKVSLIDLWQIARMRAKLILGSAGVVILMVLITLFSLTPRYTGTALVSLTNQQTNTVSIPAVLSGLQADQPDILTQTEILQSSQIASRVIDKLGLDRDPEFNGSLPPWLSFLPYLNPMRYLPSAADNLTPEQKAAQAREAVVELFLKRMDASQLQLSTAIEVDFESEDPAKAARIANAIVDAYIDQQLDTKFDASQRATQWLSSRLGQLAAAASTAEAAVENYKTNHHLTDVVGQNGSGSISVLDQQIAQVNTQLMQAQTDRAQAEANAERVDALVRSGHADQVNQVMSSPLIAQYRQQEATLVQQIAQMSQRYGAEHPKMLDMQASKRDLENKINEEVGNVVGTVHNDVMVARAHEGVLNATLSRLESQSGVQGQDRIALSQLQGSANSARALYDTFVQRAKETEQEQGLLIPDARILSRATIPIRPSFPKRLLIFALAFPAALLFGYLIAFVVERLDNGFRVASRAEELLGYPVFATLPDIGFVKGNSTGTNAADLVIDKPLSSYVEAVRGLQMGIALSNVDKAPKVVVVTSAIPGEGKSTTAVSLARHIAQTGQRVVIVDGDLRRPNVINVASAEEGEFDLIDVLSGKCLLDQALVKDSKGPCIILPVYKQVKNAPDLIESQALAKIMAQLRSAFDFVIVDSAPILPVNDTKILSRLADAVLFVVRWETTPRNAAHDAVKMLKEVHAPIAGVVLTRANTQRLHYYSFGYGGYNYAYSKYYEN